MTLIPGSIYTLSSCNYPVILVTTDKSKIGWQFLGSENGIFNGIASKEMTHLGMVEFLRLNDAKLIGKVIIEMGINATVEKYV